MPSSPDAAANTSRVQPDSRRLALLALLALVVIAAWLRFSSLGAQSLWNDEAVSWQQARLDWPGLIAATAADNYPPLQNFLIHLSIRAFGETEFALRLPSALLGVAAVPLLYWTGAPLVGRAGALLAAALLCLSSFHLWYSQEARMYALLCFASIAFAGSLTRFARQPGWSWGTASVVAGTVLLYSHPYGPLNWAALVLPVAVVAWRTGGHRRAVCIVLVQSPAILAFLPWALILAGRARVVATEGFWIPQLSPATLLGYFELLLNGRGMLAMLGLAVVLLLLPDIAPAQRRVLAMTGDGPPDRPRAGDLAVVAIWGLLPALLGTIASLLVEPVLFPRYLIGSLPALLLLVGAGLARLPRGLAGGLGMAGLLGAALVGLIHLGLGERDDFRDVALALEHQLRPGDCVAMSPQGKTVFAYYSPQGFACSDAESDPAKLSFGTVRPARVFVVEAAIDWDPAPDFSRFGRLAGDQQFGVTHLLEFDSP